MMNFTSAIVVSNEDSLDALAALEEKKIPAIESYPIYMLVTDLLELLLFGSEEYNGYNLTKEQYDTLLDKTIKRVFDNEHIWSCVSKEIKDSVKEFATENNIDLSY